MSEIQVYTDEEAAKILRMSKVTLWRRRKEGKIAYHYDEGRIKYLKEDLDNYLARTRRGPVSPESK